jgi:hypothetical protein
MDSQIGTLANIHLVGEILGRRPNGLPEEPGVYAFWWLAQKAELMAANTRIVLKGPRGDDVDVEYKDWWPSTIPYPCLYVGKSTNIKKRFSMHIKSGSKVRLHEANSDHSKVKPKTTSCQLRHGIEHVFPEEQNPLNIIRKSVGFSYRNDFSENAVAERFFEEDRLIGRWRPWFNIDSER